MSSDKRHENWVPLVFKVFFLSVGATLLKTWSLIILLPSELILSCSQHILCIMFLYFQSHHVYLMNCELQKCIHADKHTSEWVINPSWGFESRRMWQEIWSVSVNKSKAMFPIFYHTFILRMGSADPFRVVEVIQLFTLWMEFRSSESENKPLCNSQINRTWLAANWHPLKEP